MPTAVELCSAALLKLGQSEISSFTEAGVAATLCNRLWPIVRDATLRLHPWNCAIKRAELTLGGPDLATNGGFDTDASWTKGTGWTISGGVADCDGTQTADSDLKQDMGVVAEKAYQVTFTLTVTAGTLTVKAGSGSESDPYSSAGTYTVSVKAGEDDDAYIYFRADSDFTGTIDDVIVRREDPGSEFDYQFLVPTDYIKAIDIIEMYGDPDWKVETIVQGTTTYRRILCNLNAATLKYIWQNDDPDTYDPLLVKALVEHMVSELAEPLTGSASKSELYLKKFEMTLLKAQATDGAEDVPDEIDDYPILEARLS